MVEVQYNLWISPGECLLSKVAASGVIKMPPHPGLSILSAWSSCSWYCYNLTPWEGMEPVGPHRESSHREQLYYTMVGRDFWANTRAIASLSYWARDDCAPLKPCRLWDASNGGGCNPQLTRAAGTSFVNLGHRSRCTVVDTGTQCKTEWLR